MSTSVGLWSPRRPGGEAARGGGRRPGRRAAIALLLGLAAGLTLFGAAAELSAPHLTGIALTIQAQQSLQRLEELWLQWLGAYFQHDAEAAGERIEQLLATAGDLGLERLPDLADAALAQAAKSAGEGDFEAAAWALEAAERLDPGRPEQAFAAAHVSRLRHGYLQALVDSARGYFRGLLSPRERRGWLINAGIWCLGVLLASGGLFVALEMASKGGGLLRDARRPFASLPRPLSFLLALALLVWPLALPYGPLWLVLYWSLLLWGYGSPSERAVLIALWLLLGLAPIVIAAGRQRMALDLSPPVQAMEAVQQGRLYGALFTDLGVLQSMLPESPAVKHFLADLHRLLGQWDQAQFLYQQVLAAEPERAGVLLDVGAYYFYTGDFGTAVDYFHRAVEAEPDNAAAYFNLSQAYSEQYYFDESRQALEQARELDEAQVRGWMQRIGGERIVTIRAGVERIDEIRRQLAAEWGGEVGGQALRIEVLRRGLSLLAGVALVLIAVTLHLARRPFGYSAPPLDLRFSRGLVERVGRALTPGWSSAEVGEGGRAFLAILVPVALLMLPLGGGLLLRLPIGFDPGDGPARLVALVGLLVFAAVRVARAVRRAF